MASGRGCAAGDMCLASSGVRGFDRRPGFSCYSSLEVDGVSGRYFKKGNKDNLLWFPTDAVPPEGAADFGTTSYSRVRRAGWARCTGKDCRGESRPARPTLPATPTFSHCDLLATGGSRLGSDDAEVLAVDPSFKKHFDAFAGDQDKCPVASSDGGLLRHRAAPPLRWSSQAFPTKPARRRASESTAMKAVAGVVGKKRDKAKPGFRLAQL